MSYCINPYCPDRQNPEALETCQTCGAVLLIQGRYRLLKPLRELNGYEHSEIFLVDDRGSLKILKVLKDLKRLPIFELESPVQLFDREARTLQKLKHPGIPRVEPDSYFTVHLHSSTFHPHPQTLYCLMMEYIEGKNLEQWMATQPPIDQDRAIAWLKQLVEILDQVHQNELFHRDIKPSNIMLRPNGQLVLIDFGSARPMTNTYFAKVGGGSQ
ncbi:MAG TPA: AarF/UbiB family protein, partial [Allocoleopsis sp.]